MSQTPNTKILDLPIKATTFEMKPLIFKMLNLFGQFVGLPHENPHKHLKLFMRTFHSFKVNGVTNDALKLNSFKAISIYQPPIPFSQRFKKTSQDT